MKEIQVQQEKQLKRALKLLSGSDRKALTEFLQSGQALGSKSFRKIKPNVQKSVLKLNLASIEIIIKRVRNPISKLRYKLAKVSYNNMLKSIDK